MARTPLLAPARRRGLAATVGTVAALGVATVVAVGAASNAAAAPPVNTVAPTVTGTLRAGQTLTAEPGTWTGDAPIAFAYNWQQCNAQGTPASCSDAAGGKTQTYVVGSADIGKTFRVQVTATNGAGVANANSAVTVAVTAAPTDAPAATALPTITGTPETGSVLTINPGTWSGAQPQTFAYVWQKCDASGGACAAVPNATAATYTLVETDAGATFRAVVTASNASGSGQVTTVPSPKIVLGPTDIQTLPGGGKSIPVSSVALPAQLNINKVSFQPPELKSRATFTVKVEIKDTRGFFVRGAKVTILGVPYSRVAVVPDGTTGTDGTVTFKVHPLAGLELGRGKYLVFFVRATAPTGKVLAGISARRLVQVRTGPAA
jgi:hypothetical protein